jgi:hypothetical protein
MVVFGHWGSSNLHFNVSSVVGLRQLAVGALGELNKMLQISSTA